MDMVSIAKRENNNKRKYLVVNKLQGKHIPVSGSAAFEIFDSLAKKVGQSYPNEKLLLIGFAETATAIGTRLAVTLNTLFMQTTREQVDNCEYLFFTESHSHATEQKLIKNDIDAVIDKIDRIVFVEDEVTTGNTIMKIINIIENLYPEKVRFAAASLLNGMDGQSLEAYRIKNIDVHYLLKTDHSTFTEIAESFCGDGEYYEKDDSDACVSTTAVSENYLNTRRLTNGREYDQACLKLFEKIYSDTQTANIKTMAVIGTEEFMYPALFIAEKFEETGISALSHSTTRSPITTSSENDYPLHKRFSLSSFYDPQRQTFIYDLKKYDHVVIITDSKNNYEAGANNLANALRKVGCESIKIYRWCSND
ncbi:MAG: phosphoribosyltransferase domain-containing protein [Clostridia bacterium]|nr:phosphoribosyltransferase domain-containing protein [Clostridia bacterium]